MENFNISDNNWNPSYLYYSTNADILKKITDFLNLELSIPII